MSTLTGKERIARILKRQPVDRVGLFETLWGETDTKWRAEGHLVPDESADDHFDFDLRQQWGSFNFTANLKLLKLLSQKTFGPNLKLTQQF